MKWYQFLFSYFSLIWLKMFSHQRRILAFLSLVFSAHQISPQALGDAADFQVDFSKPKKVLVVLAHADDEVMSAGLLNRFAKTGSQIRFVTLTDGAANPKSNLEVCQSKNIVECRLSELKKSLDHIGPHSLATPLLPDSLLWENRYEGLKVVQQEIDAFQPDFVQSVEPSGLNGNRDHAAASWIALHSADRSLGKLPELLLTTLPFPIRLFLKTKVPESLKVPLYIHKLSAEEIDVKASCSESHSSQASTLSGLSWFVGPKTLFKIFGEERFYLVKGEQIEKVKTLSQWPIAGPKP